ELLLVSGLPAVIELLGDANADLACRATNIEARFPRVQTEHQSEKRDQQLVVLQVRSDRGCDPGILDLYSNSSTVVQPGGVDLADRGRFRARIARARAPSVARHRVVASAPLGRSTGTLPAQRAPLRSTRASAQPSLVRPWSARAVLHSALLCGCGTRCC